MTEADLSPENIEEFNKNYGKGVSLTDKVIDDHSATRGVFGFFTKWKVREGIVCLKRCVEINPFSWQSFWIMGKGHQALDEHKAALSAFESSLAIEKQNSDVPREASLEALWLGIPLKAERYAEDACARKPDDAGLLSNLALAQILNRKIDNAVDTASKAVSICGDDPVCSSVLRYASRVKAGELPIPEKIRPEIP